MKGILRRLNRRFAGFISLYLYRENATMRAWVFRFIEASMKFEYFIDNL